MPIAGCRLFVGFGADLRARPRPQLDLDELEVQLEPAGAVADLVLDGSEGTCVVPRSGISVLPALDSAGHVEGVELSDVEGLCLSDLLDLARSRLVLSALPGLLDAVVLRPGETDFDLVVGPDDELPVVRDSSRTRPRDEGHPGRHDDLLAAAGLEDVVAGAVGPLVSLSDGTALPS